MKNEENKLLFKLMHLSSVWLIIFLFFIAPFASAQLSDADQQYLRKALAEKVNALRQEQGVSSLDFEDDLQEAAAFHSNYMARYNKLEHEEHVSKNKTPRLRVLNAGGKDFELVGENILYVPVATFPLEKEALDKLAEEMFLGWKNSPGHYANMIDPEYSFGDFGFKTHQRSKRVYATQVFGKKGIRVPGQLSENAFGLKAGDPACFWEYKEYLNLVYNLGNSLKIKGDKVYIYSHNIRLFEEIFKDPDDGLAVDLVYDKQVACGKPNQLDMSPVYDGIMLEPTYRDEILAGNEAESDYRIITPIGTIPKGLSREGLSISLILINDGRFCQYLTPGYVPAALYKLSPVEPVRAIPSRPKLSKVGIIRSQTLHVDFQTDITVPVRDPSFFPHPEEAVSIDIQSWSSMEGERKHNIDLHKARAETIRKLVTAQLLKGNPVIFTKAEENRELMNFQLNKLGRADLAALSDDSLKTVIANKEEGIDWEPLLFKQRKSTATIHYLGVYDSTSSKETLGEFNLRTGVATRNKYKVQAALYRIAKDSIIHPHVIFEAPIFDYCMREREFLINFSAVLSKAVSFDKEKATLFLFHWLKRVDEIDEVGAKHNLLRLYTMLSYELLLDWDLAANQLANVVHPDRIGSLMYKEIEEYSMLNLQLTFVQYFGQTNNTARAIEPFEFIIDFIEERALTEDDLINLSLFSNSWSKFDLTDRFLRPLFEKDSISDEGLLVLTQTLNYYDVMSGKEELYELHEKCSKRDPVSWCFWLYTSKHLLRDHEIKRLYCEICN